jgi:hypothetical protein
MAWILVERQRTGSGMAFTLEQVVPWGRSFDEYVAMFALSDSDLGKRILGCADGPASFNCVLTRRGGWVVSVDPLYMFSAGQIRERITKTYDTVLAQARQNQHEFVWRNIASVEELGRIRMEAMEEFLADYPSGLAEGRYMAGSLPELGLSGRQYDLALCSHFLFLYSEHLSLDFHVRSIQELCRVAGEVRVFPLLELGARESRHLEAVVAALARGQHSLSVEDVPYEFQRGRNKMLKVCGR